MAKVTDKEWKARLADAYAVVEAAGDTVSLVELRPDVYKAASSFADIGLAGLALWGAEVTRVEAQAEPFLVYGADTGREAFVSKAQRKWLTDTYADLIAQGAEVTRITVEAENGDGIPLILTAAWPDRG
jgi:hypothetical protein